jgi:DNA-binding transcriptional LysR family regulator
MSLGNLDLNLLRVLDTVLSERSVVRAAERLHVTPSAISNALARLRHALRDPLVIRSGRGIVASPRAAALAPALKRTLADLERVVSGEGFDPTAATTQFTLAMADAVQVARLPEIEKAMSKRLPKARLRVVGIDTYLSSGETAGTEVDAAMIAGEARGPGVHASPLYKETSVLVVRRRHELAGRAEISRADLAGLQHVDIEVAPGRGYRELARSYDRMGIERRVARIVPSFIAAAALVARSDYAATVPETLVSALGAHLGLATLKSPAPKLRSEIKLVWHERTHQDPGMRMFREVVTSAVRPKRATA